MNEAGFRDILSRTVSKRPRSLQILPETQLRVPDVLGMPRSQARQLRHINLETMRRHLTFQSSREYSALRCLPPIHVLPCMFESDCYGIEGIPYGGFGMLNQLLGAIIAI